MVDGDGVGEEGLDCWEGGVRRVLELELGLELEVGLERGWWLFLELGGRGGREYEPSTMPKPERRTGTREMVSGRMVLVGYSYPRWLLLCWALERGDRGLVLVRGTYRRTVRAGQTCGESFNAQDQRDFMDQRLGLARRGGAVPELGELRLETGMGRDMDVWREWLRHAGRGKMEEGRG